MSRFRCPGCGYVYDEACGNAREGLAKGTPWSEVPDDWACPDCGVREKLDFQADDRRAPMRLNHVSLDARDVELSARFYMRLGLMQIVANYPDYARLAAPEGDTTLSLHHSPRVVAESNARIHFEVDDVDETVARLKREGFTFLCDPVAQPYLWRETVLLDPDRHRIFIYHAGVNRVLPAWGVM